MNKRKITGSAKLSVEDKIKATALDLFSCNGYFSTNISMIAKKAHISNGLIYHYFKCKTTLLEVILKDRITSNVKLFGLFNAPVQDLNIKEILKHTFDLLKVNEAYWKLVFQVLLQKNKFPNAYEIICNEYDKPFLQLLINYFSYHGYSSPEVSSRLYFSYVNGIYFDYLFTTRNIDIDRYSDRFIYKTLE